MLLAAAQGWIGEPDRRAKGERNLKSCQPWLEAPARLRRQERCQGSCQGEALSWESAWAGVDVRGGGRRAAGVKELLVAQFQRGKEAGRDSSGGCAPEGPLQAGEAERSLVRFRPWNDHTQLPSHPLESHWQHILRGTLSIKIPQKTLSLPML